jgi:hypothetical protein
VTAITDYELIFLIQLPLANLPQPIDQDNVVSIYVAWNPRVVGTIAVLANKLGYQGLDEAKQQDLSVAIRVQFVHLKRGQAVRQCSG